MTGLRTAHRQASRRRSKIRGRLAPKMARRVDRFRHVHRAWSLAVPPEGHSVACEWPAVPTAVSSPHPTQGSVADDERGEPSDIVTSVAACPRSPDEGWGHVPPRQDAHSPKAADTSRS
jgi:hypothetical protein